MRGLMGPGGGGGGRGGPWQGAAAGWLAAAGLAALLGAHLSQEVGYWAEVEAQLAEERALRERWAGWGARARAQAAQLAAAAAGEWSAAAEAGCAPCPNCPGKQERSGVAGARKGAGRRDAGAGPAAGGQKGGGRGAGGQTEQAAPAPEGGAGRQAPRSGEANLEFKVWVYPLPAKFHSGLKEERGRCVHDQYGTEIRIHEELLASPLRTLDPAEAEFFFVPIYGECFIFRAIQQKGSKEGFKEANAFYLEGLRAVREQWPHWNRTQGRDHVFVFAGARGPHIFKDWKQNIRKSVFLTPEGDRSLSEQFTHGRKLSSRGWSSTRSCGAGPSGGRPARDATSSRSSEAPSGTRGASPTRAACASACTSSSRARRTSSSASPSRSATRNATCGAWRGLYSASAPGGGRLGPCGLTKR